MLQTSAHPEDSDSPSASGVRVAIIVPVFNTEPTFLQEAVISASRQTVPVDVVMVDDGSTRAETLNALRELSLLHGVRLVGHERNMGVAAAIDTGFGSTSAPYVLAMGSDDIVQSTYAELSARLLDERSDVAIVTADIQQFGADDTLVTASGAPNGVRDMLFHNVISGASVCRRTDWEAVGGYSPLKWGEDYDFWLRVLARGGVCARIDSVQYNYRIHEGQATQTLTDVEKLADRLEVVMRNRQIWADNMDVVMLQLWHQEESLAYFKRRYGRLNDLKSRVVAWRRLGRSRPTVRPDGQ